MSIGKRSNFERNPRDFYITPPEAVEPLTAHLRIGDTFIEPCAGDGALVDFLSTWGLECVRSFDIEPRSVEVEYGDAFSAAYYTMPAFDYIITNPPWSRDTLHRMISKFSNQAPTWLLFDADWMHTKQAAPYMPLCHKIVSVGRVKWIPGSKMTGKDNCCWYLFDVNQSKEPEPLFYGRSL